MINHDQLQMQLWISKVVCNAYYILKRLLPVYYQAFFLFIYLFWLVTWLCYLRYDKINDTFYFFVFDKIYNGWRSLNLKSWKNFFEFFYFCGHGISCSAGRIEPVPHLTRYNQQDYVFKFWADIKAAGGYDFGVVKFHIKKHTLKQSQIIN